MDEAGGPLDTAPAADEVVRRARVHEALAAGDVTAAFIIMDAEPALTDPALELAAWMVAGSPRHVRALVADPRLGPDEREQARAFLADPGLGDEPPAGLDYAALDALRSEHAAKGRARALARVQLALADASPRPDWRWVHVDHALSLSRALGDARLDALVLAHEAIRDAEFGEDDDALERVEEALAAAEAAGEPRATALAHWAETLIRARPPKAAESVDPYPAAEEPTP